MHWKEWMNFSDAAKRDPSFAKDFSLKGHPEFPGLSDLDEEEVFEILKEFVLAEGKVPCLETLLAYAPVYEITIQKQNLPSIFG